jgi:hypothetical protein
VDRDRVAQEKNQWGASVNTVLVMSHWITSKAVSSRLSGRLNGLSTRILAHSLSIDIYECIYIEH